MGDGIFTGDDIFFGFIPWIGLLVGDTKNNSGEYFSGIFTGVDGRRGLVSPHFGLKGCGKERLGLPRGLITGLVWGVPGVKVSELASERSNVGLPDNSGLDNTLVTTPGGNNFPLESKSSTTVSPKSSGNKRVSDKDESILIAGMSGKSGSQSVSQVAIGACFVGARNVANSVLLSSLSIDSPRSSVAVKNKKQTL